MEYFTRLIDATKNLYLIIRYLDTDAKADKLYQETEKIIKQDNATIKIFYIPIKSVANKNITKTIYEPNLKELEEQKYENTIRESKEYLQAIRTINKDTETAYEYSKEVPEYWRIEQKNLYKKLNPESQWKRTAAIFMQITK